MAKHDPCILVCQFDGRTGWCLGWGRTVPEIRAWRKLTPYRRTTLARELPRRLGQVAGTTADVGAMRRDKRRGPTAKGAIPATSHDTE